MEKSDDVNIDLSELVPTSSDLKDSDFMSKRKKVAGNIARSEFYKFWEEELQTDIWTMNVIREGYKLPFSTLSTAYEERNKRSARKEGPYVIVSVASPGVVKTF